MAEQTAPESPAETANARAYTPTPAALEELATATENGKLTNHPLQKTSKVGHYTAAEDRFKVSRSTTIKGRPWIVTDTQTDESSPATSYENCRLVVNQLAAKRRG